MELRDRYNEYREWYERILNLPTNVDEFFEKSVFFEEFIPKVEDYLIRFLTLETFSHNELYIDLGISDEEIRQMFQVRSRGINRKLLKSKVNYADYISKVKEVLIKTLKEVEK